MTNIFVVNVCTGPKSIAIAVQTRQITLNGILKSGTGSKTSSTSPCIVIMREPFEFSAPNILKNVIQVI